LKIFSNRGLEKFIFNKPEDRSNICQRFFYFWIKKERFDIIKKISLIKDDKRKSN